MHIFALNEISEIRGKLKFFKLLVDGICAYNVFEEEIIKEANFKSELTTIVTRMHEIADLKSLPKNKFRDITRKKDNIKEYEIKTKHLRVYLFHEKNTGRVIVCGGKKGNQKADIEHFRNIKKEYLNQKR